MKVLTGSLVLLMSLLFASMGTAETTQQQQPTKPEIQTLGGNTPTSTAQPCKLAQERCPACCTNNCSDCSSCKPRHTEEPTT